MLLQFAEKYPLPQLKVNKRLGCTREGIKAIKNHAFFDGLDWEGVESQSIKAPELPKIDLEFDDSAIVTQKLSNGQRSMEERLMEGHEHYENVGYKAEDVFWVDGF